MNKKQQNKEEGWGSVFDSLMKVVILMFVASTMGFGGFFVSQSFGNGFIFSVGFSGICGAIGTLILIPMLFYKEGK